MSAVTSLDPAQIVGALLLAAVALTATLATMSERRRRQREIQAARRRHPSARPTTPVRTMDDIHADWWEAWDSGDYEAAAGYVDEWAAAERARKYHESNQWGR